MLVCNSRVCLPGTHQRTSKGLLCLQRCGTPQHASFVPKASQAFSMEDDGSRIWNLMQLVASEHDCEGLAQAAGLPKTNASKDIADLLDEVQLPHHVLAAAMGRSRNDMKGDILTNSATLQSTNQKQATSFPARPDEVDIEELGMPEDARPSAIKRIPRLSEPGQAASLISLLTDLKQK